MKIGAIIVAAGRGERAGGGIPKQFRKLAGRSVLARSYQALAAHPALTAIVLVTHPHDTARLDAVDEELGLVTRRVVGGATRSDSVRAGLAALSDAGVDAVMIHDAARPFLSHALIDRLADALATHSAVIPVMPVTDALMRLDASGEILEAVDRETLGAAQTPQAF
ncbi:MAG: 2-C-methyl-D-erythritol 4-phosphate cytidylyltransferase, partial [Alphaproteobacteria bacterium]|nr:2-C-methyl-D-erythritol 4-phosphate cytidylyltransferase [Alphaproteobacteria bacterium]